MLTVFTDASVCQDVNPKTYLTIHPLLGIYIFFWINVTKNTYVLQNHTENNRAREKIVLTTQNCAVL